MACKIILFGGTFDPVHIGHTTVVAHAADTLGADEVTFIPARRSPHKADTPLAPTEHRVNMLRLALTEHPSFSLSRCELDRPEPSYTFDTVSQIRASRPDAKLIWLVGSDAIASLSRWYRIRELLELCQVSIMSRGGMDEPQFEGLAATLGRETADRLRKAALATPLIPISSTEIRACLARGQDVSEMLHPAVLEYIRGHHLYGTAGQ
jgi:nicotinate-nucleotide adenylyltransferase